MFPRLLDKYSVMYNPVSLVEAKWIILKTARRKRLSIEHALERYRRGLSILLGDERIHQTRLTSSEIEEIADKLLVEHGLRDYFDRLIYATAVYYEAVLLTEDHELHMLSKRLSPNQLE